MSSLYIFYEVNISKLINSGLKMFNILVFKIKKGWSLVFKLCLKNKSFNIRERLKVLVYYYFIVYNL